MNRNILVKLSASNKWVLKRHDTLVCSLHVVYQSRGPMSRAVANDVIEPRGGLTTSFWTIRRYN